MWADRTGNVERNFHLVERPLEIGGGDGANDGLALVTYNVRLISANDAVQAATAVWIAEVRVRQGGPDDAFNARAMTNGAVARPGEWGQVALAVGAAAVPTAAERNAATPWRRRQRAGIGVGVGVHDLSVVLYSEECGARPCGRPLG